MGYYYKLRLIAHSAHIFRIADNVCLVQCGLDLVHNAERRWANLEDCKIQRYGHERLLSAGQEAYIRHRFSGRLNLYLNAALKRIVFILKDDRRLAAAEQLKEGLTEVFVDELELAEENLFHLIGYVVYYAQKLFLGFLYIAALPGQEFVTGIDTLKFLDSADIRRAERRYLPAQVAYSARLLLEAGAAAAPPNGSAHNYPKAYRGSAFPQGLTTAFSVQALRSCAQAQAGGGLTPDCPYRPLFCGLQAQGALRLSPRSRI